MSTGLALDEVASAMPIFQIWESASGTGGRCKNNVPMKSSAIRQRVLWKHRFEFKKIYGPAVCHRCFPYSELARHFQDSISCAHQHAQVGHSLQVVIGTNLLVPMLYLVRRCLATGHLWIWRCYSQMLLTLHAKVVHYRYREWICLIDFKEEMMDPKSKSRRALLKGGALAVGTAATGVSISKIAFAQPPASGSAAALPSYAANEAPMVPATDDIVAYGVRSRYVTSKRIPALGRPSPDDFGLEFHIATPLQDSFGTIQASSLHYVATTKGSFIPDIDPAKHTLMIDGLVDRPRVFTMADLKRFPSVTEFHFIECSGNSHNERDKTVQESHGLTSNAEWTGVRLSTLLKECGVQAKGTWFVAESSEEIKGASTIPINKGMTDVIVAYGMNGEPLRPQQGFPVRLIVPGFEGIFNTKWLRHIKVVDQYQLNMNDFGHLRRDPKEAALGYQIGPKSVITFPSGGQKLPERGWYEITGLAWSGGGAVRKVEVSTDGGKSWHAAQLKGTPQPMAHARFGFMWNWDGGEHVILSRTTDEIGQVQPTREQVAKALGVAYTPKFRVPMNNNTIMPWKIASDGTVTNGLA